MFFSRPLVASSLKNLYPEICKFENISKTRKKTFGTFKFSFLSCYISGYTFRAYWIQTKCSWACPVVRGSFPIKFHYPTNWATINLKIWLTFYLRTFLVIVMEIKYYRIIFRQLNRKMQSFKGIHNPRGQGGSQMTTLLRTYVSLIQYLVNISQKYVTWFMDDGTWSEDIHFFKRNR